MGTGSSTVQDNRRQVRGGIFIQLQKTAFISNETITGMLNINLEEPFQGHLLQVSLEGFEETHFTYTVSSGSGKHRRTRTVHARGYNNFLNFAVPIYDFAAGTNNSSFVMQPCQIQIPFSLVVAEKLPSSMKYFYSDNTRCHLQYRLTASILSTEANVKPVTGSQEIFIGQQVTTQFQPNKTQSQQEPVVFCCCRSGIVKYEVTLNARSFSPNETIDADLDVDFSQYSKEVKTLVLNLRGVLQMKASNTVRTKVINIFNKSQTVNVTSKQFKQKVQLPVPADISLSSSGSLLSLSYFLEITPEIDTCCCVSTNVPHSVAVIINPTSSQIKNLMNLPQQMTIQAPQNWNPVQLQVQQFDPQQAAYMQQQYMTYVAQEQQQQYQAMGIQPMPIAAQPQMYNQSQVQPIPGNGMAPNQQQQMMYPNQQQMMYPNQQMVNPMQPSINNTSNQNQGFL